MAGQPVGGHRIARWGRPTQLVLEVCVPEKGHRGKAEVPPATGKAVASSAQARQAHLPKAGNHRGVLCPVRDRIPYSIPFPCKAISEHPRRQSCLMKVMCSKKNKITLTSFLTGAKWPPQRAAAGLQPLHAVPCAGPETSTTTHCEQYILGVHNDNSIWTLLLSRRNPSSDLRPFGPRTVPCS